MYLSLRKQRVKPGDNYSDWSEIIKGVQYLCRRDNTLSYSNNVLQTT